MGIEGLWDLVKDAGTTCSFTTLATNKAVRSGTFQPLRIGIDISIWLVQGQQTFIVGHGQAGENPELNFVFNRMARLCRLPIIPIFVFDGPDRPRVKRSKTVVTREHWLAQPTRDFIEAFGFFYVDAPAEAEAQLARMNADGLIDAVMTDDSDAFVFGANNIIRNPCVTRDKDDIKIYRVEGLACADGPDLTRDAYILIAVLAGGDYDPVGLFGCGAKIACRLARYDLGEQLLAAMALEPGSKRSQSLSAWRDDLRTALREDPRGYLGQRHPALASRITDDFPDNTVVEAYVAPRVDTAANIVASLASPIGFMLPNTSRLSQLCERHFGWGSELEITRKFLKLVWPGVVLRHVCSAQSSAHNDDSSLLLPSTADLSLEIIGKTSTEASGCVYKVRLPPSAFLDAIKSCLHGSRRTTYTAAQLRKRRQLDIDAVRAQAPTIDIPAAIIELFHHDIFLRLEKMPMDRPTASNVRTSRNGRVVRSIVSTPPARTVVNPCAQTSDAALVAWPIERIALARPRMHHRDRKVAGSDGASGSMPSMYRRALQHIDIIEISD